MYGIISTFSNTTLSRFYPSMLIEIENMLHFESERSM